MSCERRVQSLKIMENIELLRMFPYQLKAPFSADLKIYVPWGSAFKRPCKVRDKTWKFKDEDRSAGRQDKILVRMVSAEGAKGMSPWLVELTEATASPRQ